MKLGLVFLTDKGIRRLLSMTREVSISHCLSAPMNPWRIARAWEGARGGRRLAS